MTEVFITEQGYRVIAIDGFAELCKLASEMAGIEVQNILFQDIECENPRKVHKTGQERG